MSENLIQSELKNTEKAILKDIITTKISKEKFILEIKGSLGDKIKTDCGKITKIKKPSKIKTFFQSLINKFF